MEESNSKGASADERLLAAARSDNEDLLLDVFKGGNYNINCVDVLGNTPLHLAADQGSADVLDHILTDEGCDVDPINHIEKATPLHLAVQLKSTELRHFIVRNLLEAGADTSIKDKNGDKAVDLISNDEKLQQIFRQFQTQASYSRDDIASDKDDDEPGSSSEEE